MKIGVLVHRELRTMRTDFYACSKAHKVCPDLSSLYLSKVLQGQGRHRADEDSLTPPQTKKSQSPSDCGKVVNALAFSKARRAVFSTVSDKRALIKTLSVLQQSPGHNQQLPGYGHHRNIAMFSPA